MAVRWSYTPPKVNAALAIAAAAPAATEAIAEHILTESQKLVPVDTGKLRDSGRVVPDGHRCYFTYGRDDDAEIVGWRGDIAAGDSPSNAYVTKQHEDLTLDHPNGGEAKFLERPMHSEAGAAAKIAAGVLRKVIR